MRNSTTLLIAPLLFLTLAAAPVEKTSRSFDVAGHGQIQISYPKTWHVSVIQPPAELKLPPNIKLESAEGQSFMVEMTPLPSRELHADTAEGLRKMADIRSRHDLASARETKADYKDLKGDTARGLYYSLTDKSDDPGEFKFMTAALVTVGDLVLNVTILDNDPAKPQRAQALEMLKTAKQIAAATQPAAKPASADLRIAAPSGKWELVLKRAGFEDVQEESHGQAKMAAAATDDGWAISVFFEPSQKPGDAAVVRGFYEDRLKRSPLDRADIKLGGDGKKATCQYMIKEIEQKHINVYLVREAVWVDVHISKVEFGAKDQKMLDDIVSSIRTEAAAAKK